MLVVKRPDLATRPPVVGVQAGLAGNGRIVGAVRVDTQTGEVGAVPGLGGLEAGLFPGAPVCVGAAELGARASVEQFRHGVTA